MPSLRRAWVPCLTALLSACPAPVATTPEPACPDGQRTIDGGPCVPSIACTDGFLPDPGGPGCVEVRAATCGPGTMPALGAPDCVPVGWTQCPAGFTASASGWGCDAVLPPAACGPGTLERLGSTTCVPLGDCAATFPPAEATLFVDDDGPAPDATHFRTVADAVAAAPANATIAVERGSYSLSSDITITRAVRVVGRCAAQVQLARVGAGQAGFVVKAGGDLHLSGFTLQALDGAAYVQGGGRAVLEDVDITQSRWTGASVNGAGSALTLRRARVEGTQPTPSGHQGWGVVAERGSALVLEDVVVDRNLGNNVVVKDASTQGTLTRVLLRDGLQAPIEGVGVGLSVAYGSHVDLHECVFARNRLRSLAMAGAGTTASLEHCVLSDVREAPEVAMAPGTWIVPTHVAVEGGAVVTLASSLLTAAPTHLFIVDPGSRLEASQVVLRGSTPQSFAAVYVGGQASLALSRSAIVEATSLGLGLWGGEGEVRDSLVTGTHLDSRGLYGVGLQARDGASLRVTGSSMVGNATVGIIVAGQGDGGVPSHGIIDRTLVLDTRTGGSLQAGHGVNVNSGGQLELTHSALSGNHEIGLSIVGGVATISDTVVRDTVRNGYEEFGHGILGVVDQVGQRLDATLHLARVTVKDNASVGLFADAVTAGVSACVFEGNQTAVHAQTGTELMEVSTLPSPLTPLRLAVSTDTVFYGNANVSGTGTLPLPATLGSVASTP